MNKIETYEHLFVHNYFRCKERKAQIYRYNEQRSKKVKLCSKCFESECDHNLPKDKYGSVIEQLGIWQDLNAVYGKNKFLHDGIPKFPNVGFDLYKRYIAKPVLDLPFCIVNVKINSAERIGYNVDGTVNSKLTEYVIEKRFGTGTWYGYFGDRFHSLAFFKNGTFINTRKFSLPSIKTQMLTKIIFKTDLDVVGTWYLPEVKYYHEFHRYLQKR